MRFKIAHIALCAGLLAGAQLVSVPMATAQDADAAANSYAVLLDRIANKQIETAQRQVMLQSQQDKIARLEAQIEQVPQTAEAVRGIAVKMANEIEKQIEQDLPFRREERYARLGQLLGMVNDEDVRPSDLYRRAMAVMDIEVNYGNSVSAYTGDHPLTPGRRLAACREDVASATCNLSTDSRKKLEAGATIDDIQSEIKDGNYVHFGRMSFIYLDLDSREGFRWNQESSEWDKLSSGDIINTRRAVRIARGESAPGVVTAPIRVQAAQ
ncbi:DUF3450 family protein [Litorimonas sp. WD9-15]|uniref:DUF3450 family protein n=1 Tax=Litorimonas sp. WD9-15 TaxID=3418716 RepID=UPI003CFF3BF6